jgi:hypothetical protein
VAAEALWLSGSKLDKPRFLGRLKKLLVLIFFLVVTRHRARDEDVALWFQSQKESSVASHAGICRAHAGPKRSDQLYAFAIEKAIVSLQLRCYSSRNHLPFGAFAFPHSAAAFAWRLAGTVWLARAAAAGRCHSLTSPGTVAASAAGTFALIGRAFAGLAAWAAARWLLRHFQPVVVAGILAGSVVKVAVSIAQVDSIS